MIEMTQRCWVAICDGCDRLIFAAVDLPIQRKDTAKAIKDLIEEGGSRIGTFTVEEVRKSDFGCECNKGGQRPLNLQERAQE